MFSARKVQARDLELIRRWRTDPEITKWMYTDPVITAGDQKRWFESISNDDSCIYWLISVDDKPAGVLNLVNIDLGIGEAHWGYYVGEADLRSMPLALSIELSLYEYCFETLGLDVVHNEVLAINEGVVKLHQICGNEIVEVGHGSLTKNGIAYDQVFMRIDKKRWESFPRPPFEKLDL